MEIGGLQNLHLCCLFRKPTSPQLLTTMINWDTVLGQDRALGMLQGMLQSDRVPHALLFHGPDGTGKRAAALAFAKALLCQRSQLEPCNECSACYKIDRMLHPDVRLWFAEPSDASDEDVAERLRRVGEDPYATVDFIRRPSLDDPTDSSNKQAFYAVERMRGKLREEMSMKPVEGSHKVAILTDADQMRREGANTVLKLLEEPGPRRVLILTTSRRNKIIPTILSRCQPVRFDPLPEEVIARGLTERADLAPDRATMIARMADGSYSRALDLTQDEELIASRDRVLAFARTAYTLKIDAIEQEVQGWSKLGRDRLVEHLRLLLAWVRDLYLVRGVGADANIVNVDQRQSIERFVAGLQEADLEAMNAMTEEAIWLARGNVNRSLLLRVFAQQFGRAMRGPHPGRLFPPLDGAA